MNSNTSPAQLSGSEPEKVALLVLGMHRSGTSALARLLALAGAALPRQMIEAGEGNEAGHWEPVRIALINDEVMQSLDHSWLDWTRLDLDLLSDHDRSKFERDIRLILAEEYDDAPLLVIKEPRTCRMAETYITALRDLGYRTVPAIIFRNPLEVIDSLMARVSWPRSRTRMDAALLWLVHVLEAEFATRGTDRTFCAYEDLFDNWQQVLDSLEKQGHIDFPHKGEKLNNQVQEFLDPVLRHQVKEPADLTTEPVTTGWVHDSYKALTLFKTDPQSPHAMRILDEIRSAVQAAVPMLGQSLQERERVEHEKDEAENQNRSLRSEVEGLSRIRDVSARRNFDLEQERASLQEELRGMLNSHSWKVTAPLRGTRRGVRATFQRISTIRATVSARGGLLSTTRLMLRVISHEGVRGLVQRFEANHAIRYASVMLQHSQDEHDDFVNSVLPRRRDVLLSDWHQGLIRAVADESRLPEEGQTLCLSLVTCNSARWLPGFFEALRAQDFPLKRINVVFVDNGSTDDTVALIKAEHSAYGDRFASFHLHLRPNLGFGAGHDYAIRHSSDEFILVSNVDIEFHPDTIPRLWRAAMADEGDIASWEVRQCPYEHPRYYDPVTLEPSWSSHACILMRRKAYEEVGGYEQKIFMYGEDVELSYRFRGQGWRLRYLPQIGVTHFVDLMDTSQRPHQLSGSVAANLLLRHRYGGPGSVTEGEELLERAIRDEAGSGRRIALAKARARIEDDRRHFSENLRPVKNVAFPFHGFDYEISRHGHNVQLQSARQVTDLPLVSVITRTYGDRLGLLSEALTSVINQSYPNIEHIIVEDRTDFAEPLVVQARDAYDRNIRYLKSNGAGRSRAGNFGLENANGEYLMFLDDDDLLFGDHVELLLREMTARPDHVAAYALGWDARTEFLADGKYREISYATPDSHYIDFSPARLRDMNFIPIQCIMFRRRVYEAEGGFDEDINHLEDWNLWSRYSRHGDFGFVRKLTSLYRTPADENVRQRRQTDLDAAYRQVRKKNSGAGKNTRVSGPSA